MSRLGDHTPVKAGRDLPTIGRLLRTRNLPPDLRASLKKEQAAAQREQGVETLESHYRTQAAEFTAAADLLAAPF